MEGNYLTSVIAQFEYYKQLAEKTFDQLDEKDFFWKQNEASNSISALIRHLSGNMLSRWTDFLNSDGEKPWRQRDNEFNDSETQIESLMVIWKKGWDCLFSALSGLSNGDLMKTVYIRSMPLSVIDAINRQLAHYTYHVGQIVYIGKYLKGEDWKALTIPKPNQSTFEPGLRKEKDIEMKKTK